MTYRPETSPLSNASSPVLDLTSDQKICALEQEVKRLKVVHQEEKTTFTKKLQQEKAAHEKTKKFDAHYKEQYYFLKAKFLARKKAESFLNVGYKFKGPEGDQLVFVFDEEHASEVEDNVDEIEIKSHQRKKQKNGSREGLPDHLKRVVHKPASLHVEQNVRYKYACKSCEDGDVTTAPLSFKELISKSWIFPSLMAAVLIEKYCYHVPLYRQSQIWKYVKVDLSRSLLSKWVLKAGDLLDPILNVIKKQMLQEDYVQINETPVKVLTEKASQKYMWAMVGRDKQSNPLHLSMVLAEEALLLKAY